MTTNKERFAFESECRRKNSYGDPDVLTVLDSNAIVAYRWPGQKDMYIIRSAQDIPPLPHEYVTSSEFHGHC